MPAQPILTASVCRVLCRPFPVLYCTVLYYGLILRLGILCAAPCLPSPLPTLARSLSCLVNRLSRAPVNCLGCTFEGKHTEWLPHGRGHRPVPAAVRCDWTAQQQGMRFSLKGSRCQWCSTARFDPNFYQHPRRRKGQCLAFSAALPRCWLDSKHRFAPPLIVQAMVCTGTSR